MTDEQIKQEFEKLNRKLEKIIAKLDRSNGQVTASALTYMQTRLNRLDTRDHPE